MNDKSESERVFSSLRLLQAEQVGFRYLARYDDATMLSIIDRASLSADPGSFVRVMVSLRYAESPDDLSPPVPDWYDKFWAGWLYMSSGHSAPDISDSFQAAFVHGCKWFDENRKLEEHPPVNAHAVRSAWKGSILWGG